jgi:tRNA A37 threonylcarbamoyladenosine synthetase subunit TsaC/SUA5/YrdC
LILRGEQLPLADPEEIRDRLEHEVDLVIEAGACGPEATTVIDLTGGSPVLVREGRGSLVPFGLG